MTKNLFKKSFILFIFICPFLLMAQQKNLNGTVKDNSGEALVGVSITVKGTQRGTTTDANGKFQISVGQNAKSLVFSFVGFTNQEIPIGSTKIFDVVLLEDDNALSEVVVVGYGTQKKANLTGAVSTLQTKDIENFPQSNLLNMLQGQMSGLTITQPSAQPGNDQPEVLVRGVGTIGNTSPLVVIDGFQSNLTQLSNLTPNEVESITLLKDAASAAIYGSRSANGVILVTTKKGEKGDKMVVNFDNFYGIQRATILPEYVNSAQWLELDADAINGTLPTGLLDRVNSGLYPDSLSNTVWANEVFRDAPIRNHNISIRGGSNKLVFQASLGYQQQDGIMKGTNGDRTNFRLNTRAEVSKRVSAGLNIWGFNRFSHEPFTDVNSIMNRIAQSSGLVPVRYSNGNWGVRYEAIYNNAIWNNFRNPLLLTTIGRNDNKSLNLNVQGFAIIELAKGLTFSSITTASRTNANGNLFNPTYEYTDLQGRPFFVNRRAYLRESNTVTDQTQLQNYLTYTKTFNKFHDVTLLAGHEFINFKSKFFRVDGFDFPSNDVVQMDRALSDISTEGNTNEWALQSFFGRANYAFKNKYLFEANLRVDGSSRFPDTDRYAFFPSFSVGWNITNEAFLKEVSWLSTLKLRASWGKLGNDNIGNYTAIQTYNLENNYYFGNVLNFGAGISNLANPEIRWETTTIQNIGLDMAFLKNKITANIDLYDRLTDGILYRLPLPPSMGNVNAPVQNIASVRNRGLDLDVFYRTKIKKLNLTFGGNISSFTNKVEKLNGQQAISGRFIITEGHPINSYFGYVNDGLFRTEEELKNGAKTGTSEVVGSLRFVDQDKNGVINALDRVVLGNSLPKFSYGFSTRLGYVGFDATLNFIGVAGKNVYNYENGNRPGNLAQMNYWSRWYEGRWTPDNPDAPLPALKRQGPENAAASSFWIDNADFLRLKNFELGYTIPKKITKKASIERLRVYIAGQNMLTFTKIVNVDPERFSNDISNNSYPQARVMSFGINTTF